MKKIVLCLASFSLVYGTAAETVTDQDRKAQDQANTLRWKAACFAGTVLLAIAAGITVIVLDGGTPNHNHNCHTGNPQHHGDTRHDIHHPKDNPNHFPLHPHGNHPNHCQP